MFLRTQRVVSTAEAPSACRQLAARVIDQALKDVLRPSQASDGHSARRFLAGSWMLYYWCRGGRVRSVACHPRRGAAHGRRRRATGTAVEAARNGDPTTSRSQPRRVIGDDGLLRALLASKRGAGDCSL